MFAETTALTAEAERVFGLLASCSLMRRERDFSADNPLEARDLRAIGDAPWGDSEILSALIALAETGMRSPDISDTERERIDRAIVGARGAVWPPEGF